MISSDRIDVNQYINRANTVVLDRPVAIVVAVLLLTAVFAGGIPQITTEEDETEGFAEDVPEQEAFEAINEEFGDPFATQQADTTQVIHVGGNVLTREELLRVLRFVEFAEQRSHLRVEDAVGPAQVVASELDPTAQTPSEQRRAVERATPTEVRQAIRDVSDQPQFSQTLSDGFNPTDPSATASITVISHDIPDGSDGETLEAIQLELETIAEDTDGDLRIFGGGILSAESGQVIGDSLTIVVPVVVGMILLFLMVAYRDPFDLLLGLVALVITLIWTFGFMGYAGIPFNQQMISVPIILLAVGVDFGIHAVNRYREERQQGYEPLPAMRRGSDQLVVAFFIVAATTAFGFGANIISPLTPTRNFGIVAAIGIVFTFILFGVFLPAAKIAIDTSRDRIGIPRFGTKPIASEGSPLGRLLSGSVSVARVAPVILVVLFVLVGVGAAAYGQGVDQTFDTDDFLPPEELPAYVTELPEPFAPGEYRVSQRISFLEENFEATQDDSVTIYVEGPFSEAHALESLRRTNQNPPDTFVTVDGAADRDSIVTVIERQASVDPAFGALVERNDRRGTGVPDRNLNRIYAELFAAAGSGAERYITEDRRAVQIEYSVEGDADPELVREDARDFAETFRYDATPTGQVIVFQAVTDVLFESAIQSLVIAILATSMFLVVVYGVVEGRPLLGLVNLFPIIVTVALLVATMRAAGLPLNALTGSLLSITIGVGVAYSVHITHRFIDEYGDAVEPTAALRTTLTGTGGALTGSMLTTALGTGALMLSISQVLGDFGLLLATSVVYSYVMAIVALPPALLVWAEYDR